MDSDSFEYVSMRSQFDNFSNTEKKKNQIKKFGEGII